MVDEAVEKINKNFTNNQAITIKAVSIFLTMSLNGIVFIFLLNSYEPILTSSIIQGMQNNPHIYYPFILGMLFCGLLALLTLYGITFLFGNSKTWIIVGVTFCLLLAIGFTVIELLFSFFTYFWTLSSALSSVNV